MGQVIYRDWVREDAPQIDKNSVIRIAKRMAKHLDIEYKPMPYSKRDTPESWAYTGPCVWPGAHEESHSRWIISCEGYSDTGWAWSDWFAEIVREETGGMFYAEAGNSWYVGFFSTS